VKNKFLLISRLLIILIFCISLFGQQIAFVKADLKGGGMISGIVTYTGTITTPHEIIVSIHFPDVVEPEKSIHIFSGDSYSFTETPDGTYYVYAFLDVDDSGGGPPDTDEPGGWYVDGNGNPLSITITGGNTVDNVNILLEDTEDNFCTWDGTEGTDWHTAGNWECNKVPSSGVNVIIPSTTTNDPTISSLIEVNSITVKNGAEITCNNPGWIYPDILTIDAGGSLVALDYTAIQAISITNNGTLKADKTEALADGFLNIRSTTFSNGGILQLLGDSNSVITIYSESEFNNSGTVLIDAGHMTISGVGTHSGEFRGTANTSINFSKYGTTSGQTVTFEENSVLDVPTVGIGTIVNFNGNYGGDIPSIENALSIQNDGIFQIQSGSVINNLDQIELNSGGEVINDNPNLLPIKELIIKDDSVLQNNGILEILVNFEWQGTLTGTGSTEITETSSVFINWKALPISLDGHHLINQTTFDWYGEDLALSNGATFTNNGTFNAYENSTMSGGSNGRFINNGLFTKNGTGTTTTIITDFEKNGTVNIVSGNLLFTGNLIYGSGTTLELGSGAFDTGETLILETGAELVGSGTLSSNLVNGGTVSPGSSPGIITVDGNYTQEAGGVLEIELGGDVAGTGYDQLQVTGAATLVGTLDVSLYDGFVPSNGDQFLILDAASLSGTFTTINLPTLTNGLEWQTEYTETGFSISAVGAGTITGNVTYNGSITDPHDIIVSLFGSVDGSPYESVHMVNGASYIFENVPDGTYYVAAFLDVNDSGDGPPDPDEPVSWYVDQNGDPKAVVISAGSTVSDVNITLEDSTFKIYLPLILK